MRSRRIADSYGRDKRNKRKRAVAVAGDRLSRPSAGLFRVVWDRVAGGGCEAVDRVGRAGRDQQDGPVLAPSVDAAGADDGSVQGGERLGAGDDRCGAGRVPAVLLRESDVSDAIGRRDRSVCWRGQDVWGQTLGGTACDGQRALRHIDPGDFGTGSRH